MAAVLSLRSLEAADEVGPRGRATGGSWGRGGKALVILVGFFVGG